jgi:alpha-galactosidase
VGVGDTLGPAALARNLRELPVIVEIAHDMEKHCPEAVLLNFTNPLSCVTGVVNRETSIPCWGLCHSADELFRYFSRVFGVEKDEVQMEVGGVNHQSFVTKLLIRGEDRTRDMLAATMKSDVKLEDNLLGTKEEEVHLQQDICRITGAWPSTGETHLAEFYEYFFIPKRIGELGLKGHLRKVRPRREPIGRREPPDIIMEWTYGEEPVGDLHLLTTEHAHELLWAVFTGEPFTRILNVLNDGEYLRGIPTDACVEVLVTVAGKKVTGTPIQLPPVIQSLVHRWTTIHDLSIRAALACDRDAARQALFLDPHVGDLYDIEPMLEDMLTVLREWMPRKWYS